MAHIRSVTGAAAAMALPAAGGLWALAEPVMHILYAGRPESKAAIAAEALRTLLPIMVCLCLTFPLCSILQGVGKAAVPVVCMLAGVGVKLLGNLVLIPRPAFCITGAGIATSLCYLVLLGLILWQLRRCLEKPLHLMRTLLPIVRLQQGTVRRRRGSAGNRRLRWECCPLRQRQRQAAVWYIWRYCICWCCAGGNRQSVYH